MLTTSRFYSPAVEKCRRLTTGATLFNAGLLRSMDHQFPGFVYFMRHGRTGLIKIGYSSKPAAREKTLQAEDPGLELVFSMSGSRETERRLHLKFHSKRVRGEWFSLDSDDLENAVGVLVSEELKRVKVVMQPKNLPNKSLLDEKPSTSGYYFDRRGRKHWYSLGESTTPEPNLNPSIPASKSRFVAMKEALGRG
jgi:hypothetical protein